MSDDFVTTHTVDVNGEAFVFDDDAEFEAVLGQITAIAAAGGNGILTIVRNADPLDQRVFLVNAGTRVSITNSTRRKYRPTVA
jgi:hypothetical protein